MNSSSAASHIPLSRIVWKMISANRLISFFGPFSMHIDLRIHPVPRLLVAARPSRCLRSCECSDEIHLKYRNSRCLPILQSYINNIMILFKNYFGRRKYIDRFIFICFLRPIVFALRTHISVESDSGVWISPTWVGGGRGKSHRRFSPLKEFIPCSLKRRDKHHYQKPKMGFRKFKREFWCIRLFNFFFFFFCVFTMLVAGMHNAWPGHCCCVFAIYVIE